MNIVCAICQDALEPSNDIFTTPCGHAFHFPCLIQWLEKAQNCPQCRQKVKQDKIIRLYFNFANTEAVKEDSFTLQSKIDSLSFQIKLRETELNTSREENAKLKRQNSGLREEVKNNEKTINKHNSALHALKEQCSYFRDKCQDYDRILEEKAMLKSKLDTYDNIKVLLGSSQEDVDSMLKKTQDASSLATYISIMKRELSSNMERRRELRNELRRVQHELQEVKMQKESENETYLKLIKNLEEELVITKTEKESLKKHSSDKSETVVEDKERQEEEKIEKPQNVFSRKRESNSKLDADTVSSKKIKKTVSTIDSFDLTFSFENGLNNSDVVFVSPEKRSKENSENSPYLPTKSKSILSFKDRASSRSGLSIRPKQIISSNKSSFTSKSAAQKDDSIQFDGFGGHSKVDVFPLPKSSPNKLKRAISDTSKSKKVKLDLGSSKAKSSAKPMDDYVINLT